MPIKLLQHKSWHVYNQENVARVKRDEARAAQEQDAQDERAFQAEAEARLDRLRSKSKRKRDARDDPGEKELERQLAGKPRRDEEEATAGQDEGGGDHARAIIVRPEGWEAKDEHGRAKKHKKDDAPMTTNGHLNFWAELEAGAQAPASVLEKRLQKVLAEEPDDSLTKVYLAKKGEGDPKGWYASPDGKTERERKEPVETTLERTYRDNESKRLDDPLALMNSYLKHRDHIKSGKPLPTPRVPSTRDRYIEPTTASRRSSAPSRSRDAWDDTPRSSISSSSAATESHKNFEPVVPRLLPPKHKRPSGSSLAAMSGSDKDSKSLASAAMPPPYTSSHTSTRPPAVDPAREAATRVNSERARAAALLASRRRAALAANSDYSPSIASSPARSEIAGGWGMYNREEVLAARGGGGAGGGRQNLGSSGAYGRETGGWGERKERRQERHRQSWHGGDRDSGSDRGSSARS